MPSMQQTLVIAAAAAGLAVLGSYAYFAHRAPAGPQPVAAGGAPPAAAPARPGGGGPPGGGIGVEAFQVAAVSWSEDVTAVGTLRSRESVVLRPEIAGRIQEIRFREGVPVPKGALLIALDAATQEAELAQARANLALAQANHQRNEDLFRRKFISEAARDDSAAKLQVARANLALAQARLDKTRIVAPFAGTVGIRNVSVGDYVKEGQDLVNLQEVSALKVDFRLPETYLGRLKKGQTLDLATDALPGETFTATVDAIDPLVDSTGRAVLLRAQLPNAEGKLRPGMFARVRLIFGERKDVLAVPEEALVPQGADQFVFKVNEGKAQRVRITTGARRAGQVEVTEGLAQGDLVVTAGQLKLRDGAPVQVARPAGAGSTEVGTGKPGVEPAVPAKQG